jgi:AraC family transcriptional activator of pobA
MKKAEDNLHQFNSLAEAHRALGLPQPKHPLISLITNNTPRTEVMQPTQAHVLKFYKISYRPKLSGKIKYGQGHYDFDEGGLLFAAPNQVIGSNNDDEVRECSLYTLLIHPDFLWNYPLAKKIKTYGFFSYTANEGLHLSEQEKETIISVLKMIEQELDARIDDHSQDVIISQVELLLTYAERFYKRQFITRKAINHGILQQIEKTLDTCFNDEKSLSQGIPTVQYLAETLNISPSYLSDMLRMLTGQNAQQHIHQKLIEKAKEKLSTTSLTVSEVAYTLGFEHSQSFSKLFKAKTNLSPLGFRQSFN